MTCDDYVTYYAELLASEYSMCPCCYEIADALPGYCGTCGRCIETCAVCGDALADFGCPSCVDPDQQLGHDLDLGSGIDDDDPSGFRAVLRRPIVIVEVISLDELDQEIYGDELPF